MIPIRDNIPSRHPPVMTAALLAANALVFLFIFSRPGGEIREAFATFGIVPARFLHAGASAPPGTLPLRDLRTLLTSMFLHGGWLHLVGNLWTLWIFGDNVEDRMGPARFLLFYVSCGLAAGLTHLLTNAESAVPTVGASGAIAGVMGAYFLLYPRARVTMVLPLLFLPYFFEIPAFVFLSYWFLAQVFSGTLSLASPSQVGGVAWWAHGGGFLAGAILFRAFLRKERRSRD